MFNPLIAQQHLDSLLTEHQITVVKWSSNPCGRAWVSKREVKIPKPTTVENFCVAMHELGHVIENASKSKMPLYRSEFIAENFAMSQAKLLRFDYTHYKERARRYIIMCIAKGYVRKLNLSRIESDVIKFCKVDFKSWNGKKVFVSGWGGAVLTKPLTINIID